ncbi:MAG: amidohydrolase [Steroidobacterales bacterium]
MNKILRQVCVRSALAPALVFAAVSAAGTAGAAVQMADVVYRNGHVYTADQADSVQQAVAIRAGRLIYVGSDVQAAALVGPATRVIDLKGRTLMPGLVDGHMHPLEGGANLLKCNLNYEPLTVPEFQRRIQACLDATRSREPDGWLEVVSWFQQAMVPADARPVRATLDVLKTSRPIMVSDSFGHTELVNSRALQLAKIDRSTPDPVGGVIEHDAAGEPSGILQDAGYANVDALLPRLTPAQALDAARAALKAIAQQGVTSFLDADPPELDLVAFSAVQKAGGLTARAHFAPPIDPVEADDPRKVVAAVIALRRHYDQGALKPAPGITVRNAKLFLDGVIAGPAFTGAMLQPYLVNRGTAANPEWVAGPTRGPDVYFPAPKLKAVVVELARVGLDPHLHVDGDRAVREALDGIAAMREAYPGADIRPGLAHCEIVSPEDYGRFAQLRVFPVLSLQWGKPAPDTVDHLRDYLGPQRAAILEPAGLLAQAGAQVAFGSDWPVDALDEWFAIKVGVTRTNSAAMGAKYAGRLGADPGLERLQALRAATIVAARELHQDAVTGSLEKGKFADLIVLDRDPLSVAPEELATIRALQTMVGGRIVYQAPGAELN